jgi:hypothetical protein
VLVAALQIKKIAETAPEFIAVAAGVGILLLLPLYLSQRRDLKRLVAWMEYEPEHPAEDVTASEAILDRAETEIEVLTGEFAAVEPGLPSAAVARVTTERPALERVTMERAALQPHPRWRRFRDTITRPRWLVAIAVGALIFAVAGIFGTQLVLQTGDEGGREARIDPGDTTVAVLNGTTAAGLGDKVGDDVESNQFKLGAIATFPEPIDSTVVLFEPGSERAARRLSVSLGGTPVQPIDRQAQRLADGADVVVIAGQDRVVSGPGKDN